MTGLARFFPDMSPPRGIGTVLPFFAYEAHRYICRQACRASLRPLLIAIFVLVDFCSHILHDALLHIEFHQRAYPKV